LPFITQHTTTYTHHDSGLTQLIYHELLIPWGNPHSDYHSPFC